MGKKNLAIEALRKLINGEIRSQSRRNVTQSKGPVPSVSIWANSRWR